MWASFSPTDPNIFATAAWDKTYQIWNLNHKKASSIIGPTVGQNWSGDFSPDGKHVLLSGTHDVGVYSVATSDLVAKLERPNLAAWIRNLEWSPAGDAIALCNKTEILLWNPFSASEDERKNASVIVMITKPSERMLETFMGFHAAKWIDGKGDRLAVMAGDGTVMVWDRKENWKWRVQRPQGRAMPLWSQEIVGGLLRQRWFMFWMGIGRLGLGGCRSRRWETRWTAGSRVRVARLGDKIVLAL